MQIVPTNMTIAEYCESFDRKALRVNTTYQRSNKVWPLAAQSFLIESILKGFPIPKISLFAQTDRISRKTVREIVDGQQRTTAIYAFYNGDLRLSRTIDVDEAAGRTYDELVPHLQDQFLTYSLAIDEFVNTTEREIREVFRRINSYVVALNPEEQRHARWQGDFKWYIYHLSSTFDDQMSEVGVFTKRQLVRMQDMKLFAEVTHALNEGFMTTNKRHLDRLYEHNDERFDQAEQYSKWISDAVERLFDMHRLWKTPLVKPYSTYSFLLAAIHAEHDRSKLRPSLGQGAVELAATEETEGRLLGVVDALENKSTTGPYGQFVKATISQTNVKRQRETRARLFLDALRADGGETF
jgi:hypothetical protein